MHGRTLLRPGIVVPVLAWAVLLGLLPNVTGAAPLPPTGPSDGATVASLEARSVTARLVALGVSPDEAAARVAGLTDAEREELARRVEEIGAGGSVATVLAIAIILGLLVVLVLELMGRRVISRP